MAHTKQSFAKRVDRLVKGNTPSAKAAKNKMAARKRAEGYSEDVIKNRRLEKQTSPAEEYLKRVKKTVKTRKALDKQRGHRY